MKQQPPRDKSIFLFLVFIGFFCPIKSQSKKEMSLDTIVINETKIVYDTIFVYDTLQISKPIMKIPDNPVQFADSLSEMRPFSCDTALTPDTIRQDITEKKFNRTTHQYTPLKSRALTVANKDHIKESEDFFCELPATNLKKNIISVKTNKKLMKIEENRIKNANPNFWGITLGGSGWWFQSFDCDLTSNALLSSHIGVYFKKEVINHLYFKTGLNYRWIATKGIDFSRDNFEDFHQPPSLAEVKESEIFNWDIDGKKDDEFRFSQIDIPLKLGYKIGVFQPCIGFDYTRRFRNNKVHNGNYFNVIAGLDIVLSKRLSLELSYSHGIREEIQRNGQILGIVEGNIIVLPDSKVVFTDYPPEDYLRKNTGKLSSRRIDISLFLNLHSN
ncbi:MAG: hypothetical protein JXA77_11485 [Bacteroidales bacterium]|nr:hypothetical protein [Bacteroidales bacterium]